MKNCMDCWFSDRTGLCSRISVGEYKKIIDEYKIIISAGDLTFTEWLPIRCDNFINFKTLKEKIKLYNRYIRWRMQ